MISKTTVSGASQLLLRSLKRRMSFLMLSLLILLSLLIIQAARLQLCVHPKLEAMARRQFQSNAVVQAKRGSIYDRNGEALAVNIETRSLAAHPGKIQNKAALSRLLSRQLGKEASFIESRLNERREFVWLKRHLSEAELHKLDLSPEGLWLVKESRRVYPYKRLAAAVLGSVDVDSNGIEGVELWKNNELKGQFHSFSRVKDARGWPVFFDLAQMQPPQDGKSVRLTLDAALQFEIEQELEAASQASNSQSGEVLVLNAVNGEVLAMANYPSFDSNQKLASPFSRRNRILTDGFEPGSTLKAVLMAAALSQGWKARDQIWGERGALQVQGHWITEAESREKFEWLSLSQMLQVSSNIVASKLALKLGATQLRDWLLRFGFAAKTSLGFPGEISGRVLPLSDWNDLLLATVGFGQGIFATPIQIARTYAVFLNGGWLVEPRLLLSSDGGTVLSSAKRVISQEVALEVSQALNLVTSPGGTGVNAAILGYQIAGKTGTSQVVDPQTGQYSKENYVASFVGFSRFTEPKLVVFVALHQPKGKYYASSIAAPLFKKVFGVLARRYGMPKVLPKSTNTMGQLAQEEDQKTKKKSRPLLSEENLSRQEGPRMQNSMPHLLGLSLREALAEMPKTTFQLEIRGQGVIQAQMPSAGSLLQEKMHIKLTLADPAIFITSKSYKKRRK